MKSTGFIVTAVLLALLVPAYASAGKVVLPKDTEVKVKFDPAIQVSSGKLQPGLKLAIYLAGDVQIGGKTIIEAGAEGTAKVVEVVENGRVGKPGKLKVEFLELTTKGKYKTAGDTAIKLSGSIEQEGKGRKILSLLFIFGLFIKGTEGEIDTAQEYIATIGDNVVLDSD